MFRSKKKESKDEEYGVKVEDLRRVMYVEDKFGRIGLVRNWYVKARNRCVYDVFISFDDGSGVEYKDIPGDYIIRGIKIKEGEEKTMEKKDLRELLKDGDIVTVRNGDRLVYYGNGFDDLDTDNYSNDLSIISDLDVNLNYIENALGGHKKSDSDVIRIERPILTTTIWEREEKEPVEMTLEEVCEKLGYDVKIVKKEEE